MGCFLGCFGFPSKRRPRKPANKVQPGDHRHGCYEPLDSSVPANLDATENLAGGGFELSNKATEKTSIKVRKKVSFNLKIQAYEPIPNADHVWECEEEKKDESSKEIGEGSRPVQVSEEKSAAPRMGSYPSNYRYQNCTDSYDEEDDIAYEERDLDDYYDDDEDQYEYDGENDIDEQRIGGDKLSEQFCILPVNSHQQVDSAQLADNKTDNLAWSSALTNEELKSSAMSRISRDRSQYVSPVLNPVENLSQWKAIKTKAARRPQFKQQTKENVRLEQEPLLPFGSNTSLDLSPFGSALNCHPSKPLLQEVAVDASLSNWLASSNQNETMAASINKGSRNESMATSINRGSRMAVENKSSERSMFETSHSWRNREDMPILDITNLETK